MDEATNRYTSNDQEKAETFSKQFCSVFTTEPDTSEMPFFEERAYKDILETISITPDMVHEKLEKIKVNKSPGTDNTHPRVLHEIKESISEMTAYIFTTSLRTKTLPQEWKRARVSAIYK